MEECNNIKQGTDEWRLQRCGKVTASRLNDVLATIKIGEAAGRINYRMQLVVETLTGIPTESYCNGAMQWGTDNEPFARECYEFQTGTTVEQVGFIYHPEISGYGASPDGLVGEDGQIEIKCPNTANHVEWMLSGSVPSDHINQIQGQLDCTGRKWCDFVSYDPRMPIDLQLFIVRVDRDDAKISAIREGVIKLRGEIADTIDKLKAVRK